MHERLRDPRMLTRARARKLVKCKTPVGVTPLPRLVTCRRGSWLYEARTATVAKNRDAADDESAGAHLCALGAQPQRPRRSSGASLWRHSPHLQRWFVRRATAGGLAGAKRALPQISCWGRRFRYWRRMGASRRRQQLCEMALLCLLPSRTLSFRAPRTGPTCHCLPRCPWRGMPPSSNVRKLFDAVTNIASVGRRVSARAALRSEQGYYSLNGLISSIGAVKRSAQSLPAYSSAVLGPRKHSSYSGDCCLSGNFL